MSEPKKKSCCTPTADHSAQGVGLSVSAASVKPNKANANTGDTTGMIRLDGGAFRMGTDYEKAFPDDGEGPVREVTVRPFYIDTYTVTNEQFAAFVDDTGYKTESEKFGWSFVFRNHLPKKYAERLAKSRAVVGLEWWLGVPGATWKKPEGERSNLKGRMNHPVVQVSWNDAVAYANWAGKRLPTEAEWEFAARGGLDQKLFAWGDELTPRGEHRCNVWQGKFPDNNTCEDGFDATCPVDHYEPNAFGLYNVAGNVWEWVHDWFDPAWHVEASDATRSDPQGPDGGSRKVQKGGSFLCHASYCNRYRVAARMNNTPDSASNNAGFRCVRDV